MQQYDPLIKPTPPDSGFQAVRFRALLNNLLESRFKCPSP